MAKAKAKAKPVGAGKKKPARRAKPLVVDPTLFAPLTEGERADAVRTLMEDERLRAMAKIGRYRVVAVEPLSLKPPETLAGRRLARVSIYDYASDQAVDAAVDLEHRLVCMVSWSTAQPMLSREEEGVAAMVAMADARVMRELEPGDVVLSVLHHWSRRHKDLSYARRSAAVVFGKTGLPTVVAVVDLTGNVVSDVVRAEQW